MVIAFLLLIPCFQASSGAGNIHTKEKFAWSENTGWINLGPTQTDYPVTVHDTYLTGYAWAENIGWIKLSASEEGPSNSTNYGNTSNSDWGVNMASNGSLTGFAWSESAGWIKFNPALSGDPVWLNKMTGIFEGYAWGENIGYIHFQGTAENGQDYTLTTPRISINDPIVEEDAGSVKFTVTMSTTTLKDVIISYETFDGSDNTSQSKATNGIDYSGPTGTERIHSGTTSQTISIPIENDYLQEPAEYFTLHIYQVTNASIQDSKGVAKILDDDGHTITFTVGEHGAISAKAGTSILGYAYSQIDGVSGGTEKSMSVKHETDLVVTLMPDPGFKVTSIVQNGSPVLYDEVNNRFTISNILEDYVLEFNFVDTTFDITLDQNIENGTCEIIGSTTGIQYNASRTVKCTGDTNYHLINLNVCGNTIEQAIDQQTYEHTFNVTKNCSIDADFAIDSYSIVAIIASGEGSITAVENFSSSYPDAQGHLNVIVAHNMRPKIRFSPNGYHHIKDITLIKDGQSTETSISGDCYFNGTSCDYTFDSVQSSYTLTALFDGNSYTMGMIAGDGGYIKYTDNTGQWIEVHDHAFIPVAYKSSRTIEIYTDDTDLYIADINLDGKSLSRVSARPYKHNFTDISAHHVIHAKFAHILVTQSTQLGGFSESSTPPTAVKTIQDALSSAVSIKNNISRDPIIAVDPGTYNTVTFVKQALTLYSIQGPENTIIDANKGSSCFIFDEITDSVIVSGFTLKNGLAKNGGGIYIYNSSPDIKDCRIIDNEATKYGGGIYISINKNITDILTPRLSRLYIRGNIAGAYGGGIYCGGESGISRPRIYQTIIRKNFAGNHGGGIYVDGNSANALADLRLASSWIVENQSLSNGAGIYVDDNAKADIYTTTISNNNYQDGFGGGIFAKTGSGSTVTVNVEKSILWNNNREIDIDGLSELVNVTYSTIKGGSNANNNNAYDPAFVNTSIGDYHLKDSSLIIDKGGLTVKTTDPMYSKDIDGYSRKTKDGIDIGGDEWNNLVPNVNFSTNNTSGYSPLTVSFTNSTTGQTTLNIWKFGDGEISNDINPTHIYKQPGTYTVQLTVFDSNGYSATKSRYDYIVVADTEEEIIANFIASPSDVTLNDTTDVIGVTGYNPLNVQFLNLTSPETITAPYNYTRSWLWEMWKSDDGAIQTIGTEKSPLMPFSNSGTYSVKLTVLVQGDNGETIRKTKTRYDYITVLDSGPKADFEIVPPECIIDESGACTVTVYDRSKSQNEISEWHWDCDNGQGSFTVYNNSPQTCRYTDVVNRKINLTVDSADTINKDIHITNLNNKNVNAGGSIQSVIDTIDDINGENTIIISAGNYNGNLDLKGKNITLKAKSGDEHKVFIAPTNTTLSTIKITQGETVTLDGLVIQENNGSVQFGGGILVDNASTLFLKNCIVKKNDATIAGGGIAFLNNSKGAIENSIIGGTATTDKNTAPYGGGVACLYESSPMIVGNTYIGKNIASINGGGIYAFSGANPVIMHTTIISNYASFGKGGGIYASQAEPYVDFSTIQINEADLGGGMYLKNANRPVVKHSRIIENKASNSGGGIYASVTVAPQILNVLIASNTADVNGAGNYLHTVFSANYLFSTIANNTATKGTGSGIYGDNLSPGLIVKNSILKNNGVNEVMLNKSEPARISNTAIIQAEYQGDTIITTDPKFKTYGTATPNYQLDTGSPCQDAASDNSLIKKDLSGNDRKIGDASDLGVYESNMWPINIIHNGYGKITDSSNAIISSGNYAAIEHKDSGSFTVEPFVGYKITDVLVDGVSELAMMTTDGNRKTYTFTNVQEKHTFQASFNRYSVTVAIHYQGENNGSTTNEVETSLTMTAVTETGTQIWLLPGSSPKYIDVYHGSSLTLTAVPGTETQNPIFSGGTPVIDNSYSHVFSNISESTNITVTAKLKEFNMTIKKDPLGSGQGNITPYDNTTTQVKYGDSITLEATPASSSKFSGWAGSIQNDPSVTIDSTKITIDNIRQHYDIIGKFDYKDISVTVKRVGNDGKIIGWLNGTLINGLDTYVAENSEGYQIPGVIYNNNLELKAQKMNSWKFDRWEWTTSNASVPKEYSPSTDATHEWNNMHADTYDITGYFSLDVRTITIEQQADTYGSGTLYIDQTARSLPITLTYSYDTAITIEAVADTYSSTFLGWSGDEGGDNNLIHVTMDDNKTVYVNFSLKKFAIIAQSKTSHGSITPLGTNYVSFGTDKTFELYPVGDDAYLSDIIIDNNSVIDELGQVSTYTFTHVTQAHKIEAVFSQIVRVNPGESIQGKIATSMDGDTILVAPGVYRENINFNGKDITVKSEKPFEAIIDGKYLMNTVRFVNDETRRAILTGFIIRHGDSEKGGGIYIDNASPTIDNCRIEDNSAELYGGGIYINGESSPLITQTIIQNNRSIASGAGLYCYKSTPTLSQSIITQNETQLNGGAIYSTGNAGPNLLNTLIYDNFARYNGGGIAVNNAGVIVKHCTVVDNNAGEGIALYAANVQSPNQVVVQNSIFWQTNELAYYVIASDNASDIQVIGSDIFQKEGVYSGTGNINLNPAFIDLATHNYQIKIGSPCLNTGLDLGSEALTVDHEGFTRPYGQEVDMGAFEYNGSVDIKHVDFYASSLNGHPGMVVQCTGYAFSGERTYTNDEYLWELSTGQTSSGINQSFTFNAAGQHAITLTVDGASKTRVIVVKDTPTANFTASTTGGYAPFKVQFTDETISSHAINSWRWNFGDGIQSVQQHPEHIYERAGTYTVEFTVVDKNGNSDTSTKYYFITVLDTIPEVDFIARRTIGNAPLTVQFFDTTTSYQALKSWNWNFGDKGASSTNQNPVYIYHEPGKYTVSLIVKDSNGSYIETKQEFIDVKSDAKILHVCQSCGKRSNDYITIQAAINVAANGDMIEVYDGSYRENISFKGKNVKVYSANGPIATSILSPVGSNTSVVTFNQNENSGAVLQGFTISSGNAQYGAGILIANGASPSITNCTIKNCTAEKSGGGIAVIGNNSNPNISGVTISDNYATNGAGIACLDNARIFMDNVSINQNIANDSGAGIYVFADAAILAKNVTVKDNTASNYGGGVYLNQTSTILRGMTIKNNKAAYGSGIAMRANVSTLIDQCRITNQLTANKGGGIYAWSCDSPEIRNTYITLNMANEGGGIYFDNVTTPLIHFSTLADNYANSGEGEAIHVFSDTPDISPIVNVRNSILWDGGQEIKTEPENLVIVSWSDIAKPEILTSIDWIDYTGNINLDPIFSNDVYYNLLQGSPCKNIASTENAPNVDYHGDSRPLGTGYDMGADEATNVPPVAQEWTVNVLEDEPTEITLRAADEDGDNLTYQIVEYPQNGQLIGIGSIRTYEPDTNYNGTDSFSFIVSDARYDSNRGKVTINVDPVNDPPEFTIDSKIEVYENSATTRIDRWVNDFNCGAGGHSSESMQTLSFHVTKITNPENFINPPVITNEGTITFTIADDKTGTSQITVELHDNGYTNNNGQNISSPRLFDIEIKDINDPPTFTVNPDYLSFTVCEDALNVSIKEYVHNISKGSINEKDQRVWFEISVDHPELFQLQPAIASEGDNLTVGTLTFVPAPDMNGIAKLTILLKDNGCPDTGCTAGSDTSIQHNATIKIVPVNDRPNFTSGGDVTVNEDSGTQIVENWVKNPTKGPSDENGQTLSYILSSNFPTLFQTDPSISLTGDLTFTPAKDMHGVATVTVKARDNGGTAQCDANCIGIDTSYLKTFLIIVKEVNDPPTFTPGNNIVSVIEDEDDGGRIEKQWATNVSSGANEDDQTVRFHTSTEQVKMFSYAPYISNNGILAFALNPHVYGEANVSVYLKDSLGASSQVSIFTIKISEINDPPTFTMSNQLSVLEDSGERFFSNWADNIYKGPNAQLYEEPFNEKDQSVKFRLTTNTTNFFSIKPEIDSQGTLRFKTASNVNGTAKITVKLIDNGTSNGVDDFQESDEKEFTLTVTAVNDAPSFDFNSSYLESNNVLEINETATPDLMSYSPFIINIHEGGINDNESEQTLNFVVTSNNSELFTTQPTIDKYGSLRFEPKSNAAGLAVVNVSLHDTGGTANNGKDTSPAKTFTIKIIAVNNPPVFTLGTDPIVVPEDCGFYEETGWITGISPGGGSDETDQILTFVISVEGGNNDQFFTQTPKIVFDNGIGNLLFEPGPDKNGERRINVFLKDNLDAKSATRTFTIRVESINDPPSFDLNYETLTINEDKGEMSINMASNMYAGAADETDQTDLSFHVSVNDPDLFSVQPAINSEGILTFQTGANKSGDCTIKVRLDDNQAENNISLEQTFILSIEEVNDPPTFVIGPDQTIKEDSRVQYLLNWATNIDAGASNESYQLLSFIVEATDTTLFLVQPAVRSDGMLSYTPAPNAFGSTQVRVSLKDDGGTAYNGDDTSNAQSFGITILAVNDRPSFDISQEPVNCDEDSGLQLVKNWAYNVSPGPLNEHTQELTFVISTNNDALFETLPQMDPFGHLQFTPAENAFGSAAISVYLQDNGGMDNNGINKSYVKQFSIVIDPENDKPSFVVGQDITVREDASNQKFTNWATQISAGADNEDQVLTFKYEIDNDHLFSTLPNISRDGTLTFTPAEDENGFTQLTIWLEDDTKYGAKQISLQQTFTINILKVNDKPVFSVGPELTVYEDSGSHVKPEWAYDISAGANNESGEMLTFHTSTDNTALFQRLPQLTPDGDLSFTLSPNQWGTATVTLTLNDTGGTENGGQDISNTERITIKVLSVNDGPYFTKGPDQLVSEGAPLQEKPNWATNINAGPPDESDQTILFLIVVDKPQLFEVQPTISSDGKLTYKPAVNASGIATVNVQAKDNGGTANAGVDMSEIKTFTITIQGSNDPPTFVKGEDPTVLEDSGEQIFSYWATQISAGGPGEEDQELTFVVTVNDSSLFEKEPVISEEGTLTFTPEADQFGETSVEVFLQDNGSGTNMSTVETFNIIISPVNDRPSFTRGANLIIFEDRGEQIIPNWVTNISVGPWNEEKEQTPEFQIIPEDPRYFAAGPYISENGELKYTPALNRNGDVSVRIYLKDDGGRLYGGEDTSYPQDFNITILGINDAPSFNLHASKYSVKEDSGRQVISNWASNINTGAVDEAGQTVVFRLSHKFEYLFSEQPAISQNGVLSFTPKPDASGEAKILVFLEDDGGTANGGVNVSTTKEFIIDIIAINDPPTFNKGADVRVNEDSGAKVVSNWAQNISPGAVSEIGQTLTFVLDVSNASLFAYGPEISSVGTLTFTPAPNTSGTAYINVTLQDNGGVDYGGDFTSDMQDFVIEIIPTNDKPTFTVGPNQEVLEGAGNQIVAQWATNISAGAEDENDQTLQFKLVTNNPALFIREPAVNDDGTLHYELKDNVSGVASVTIYLEDNGPSTPPNQNISDEKSFKITVLPVNDPPSFTKGPNKYISEDASEQQFEKWATNISPGPTDESSQILTFSITTDNDDLFAVYPTVTSTGTLIFKTKPDLNGVANVSIQLHDNGGSTNGGISSSAIQVFMITVYEVNDQPTFTKGTDQIILEDAGEQNVIGWAKDISPGPVNESGQLLTFHVTPDNASLFAVPPEISMTGKLTYTPKNDIFGSTLVSVFLRDNGGVENGGNNTSAMYQFTIRIESVNDAPSFTPGPGKTVYKSSGLNSFSNWATNVIPGPTNESSQTLNFVSATSGDNIFTQNPSVSPTGTLSFVVASGRYGTATVSLYLKDDGGTLNYGDDRSDTITFQISVIDANAPPFFTKGLDQSVPEDCGEIRISNWATGIDPGAPDETAQSVEFYLSTDNDNLFGILPQISPTGELTFTPAPNLYGEANVSVYLKDDGGTTNGGNDTSSSQEFHIEVLSVNDKPEFRMENDFNCEEDGPEQFIIDWAYDIKAGPDNESGQALTFLVTSQKPELFSKEPTIMPSGTLIFKSAPNASGDVIVTVQLQDDGSVLNGGQDTSNDVHFTIHITPKNDPPVNTTIPWITGTPEIGETLTGHQGVWNDNIDTNPGTLTPFYQWQEAYSPLETSPSDILGERQDTFTILNTTKPYVRLEITVWDDGEGTPGSLSTIAYSRYIGIGKDPADIDDNGRVDLADVLITIQALSGIASEKPMVGGDINGDGQLGLADVIYILVELSQ
jgi:PKD repeat protein